MKVHNIYKCVRCHKGEEVSELLASSANMRIEKIISDASSTKEGFWYDQKEDEFVLLLQGRAELLFETGGKVLLKTGDYIVIPKRVKHRVIKTSSKPKCIWLTVFGKFKNTGLTNK